MARTLATGFCMGAADVVPGVSGGTVALLAGIYSRLLKAVTRFDRQALSLIKQREWKALAEHCDFGLIVPLLGGLAFGFVLSALTIKKSLDSETLRPITLAWFCGMILASAFLLFRSLKPTQTLDALKLAVGILLGTAIAATLGLAPPSLDDQPPSYLYLYLCGAVGICAMILPGISGAMILLLLGIYYYLLGVPERALEGDWLAAGITVIVFGLGCLTGLFIFSRVLSWLLSRFEFATRCGLVGLMLGSIVRLWPFQKITEHDGHKSIEWLLPPIDARLIAPVVAVAFGLGCILGVKWIAEKLAAREESSLSSADVDN